MLFCMALFLIASSTQSFAATQTQPIDVSATVPGACSLSSTTPPLVEYDPVGNNATTDLKQLLGTFTITCNTNTTATFSPDNGRYGVAAGAYFQNRLYQYANNAYLNYAIYQDAAYTTLFGATATSSLSGAVHGATESVAVTTGVSKSVNVYMDIPAGQNQSPGLYTDQIDFTVTY